PLVFVIKGGGKNTVILNVDRALRDGFEFHLAMPATTFEHFVRSMKGEMKGFKFTDVNEFAAGKHGLAPLPVPATVIRSAHAVQNSLDFGPMTEGHFAAMSLGIEHVPAKVPHGSKGDVTVTQQFMVTRLDRGSGCYKIERAIVGGFTLQVRATDPHIDAKGRRIDFGDN